MTGEAQGTTVQPPGSGQRWWRCRYCGDGRTFVGTVEQEAREATSHEASCPQRPAGPQPWTCPTPQLDLSQVEWTACEVKPGTAYVDEPSVEIDPGWYVHGFLPDHDPRDFPPVTIKVEAAYDEHGCDRGQYLAWHLAGVLSHRHPERKPSRLRRFADGIATLVGEAVGR